MELSPRTRLHLRITGVVLSSFLFLLTLVFLAVGGQHEIDIRRHAPDGATSSTAILVFLSISLPVHLFIVLGLLRARSDTGYSSLFDISRLLLLISFILSLIAAVNTQLHTFGWLATTPLQGLVLFYAYIIIIPMVAALVASLVYVVIMGGYSLARRVCDYCRTATTPIEDDAPYQSV